MKFSRLKFTQVKTVLVERQNKTRKDTNIDLTAKGRTRAM